MITDDRASARAAGLRYASDARPGITRRRAGRGFSYRDADGRLIRDPETLDRIRRLAIPPAWTDVWICPSPNGHLQATGRDARGRKQYRYHARWRARRDDAKFERLIDFARILPAHPGAGRPGPRAAGAAAREGPGRGRPTPRDDPHPGRQRGVRPAQPVVRADHASNAPRSRDRDGHPLPVPRQVRAPARGGTARSAPGRRRPSPARTCPARSSSSTSVPTARPHDIASDDVNAYLREISGADVTRQGLPDLGRDGPRVSRPARGRHARPTRSRPGATSSRLSARPPTGSGIPPPSHATAMSTRRSSRPTSMARSRAVGRDRPMSGEPTATPRPRPRSIGRGGARSARSFADATAARAARRSAAPRGPARASSWPVRRPRGGGPSATTRSRTRRGRPPDGSAQIRPCIARTRRSATYSPIPPPARPASVPCASADRANGSPSRVGGPPRWTIRTMTSVAEPVTTTSIGSPRAAVADRVVEQVAEDVHHQDLVGAIGRRVARPQEADLHARVAGHHLADRPFDEVAERDRLADRAQALAFRTDEARRGPRPADTDDLPRARYRPPRRGGGVGRRSRVGEQLRPAVDRGHRRPELVGQDVEKGLPVRAATGRSGSVRAGPWHRAVVRRRAGSDSRPGFDARAPRHSRGCMT